MKNVKSDKAEKTKKSLFQNNRFVLAFSILFAIVIWVVVALTVSPEIERVITDVPVVINMENSTPEKLSLRYFVDSKEEDLLTVDVTVTGKRYAAGGLTKDDFTVTAVTSAVNSSGYHTLKLQVTPSNDLTSVRLSKDSILIYFDTYSETEFTVQSEIIANKVTFSDDYIQEKEILSLSTVVISGATKEIDKISNVIAKASLSEPIKTTTTYDSELTLVTKAESDTINMDYITIDGVSAENPIRMTIPVLKKKLLPVSVKFTGVPEYYLSHSLPITFSPSKIWVAAIEENIDNMTEVYVGTIDFGSLGNKNNQFLFTADSIIDAKAVNVEDDYSVQVDTSNMHSKKLSVNGKNIEFKNIQNDLTATLSQTEIADVVVVGPPETLDTLTADGLYAEVDLKNSVSAGTYKAVAKIHAKSVSNCWVYGVYTVNVVLS